MNGEFEIIRRLTRAVPSAGSRVIVGIGDDAAVLRGTQGSLVATVDALVEGVHFDLRYCMPSDIGHRALAVNLSDVAAMGATPRHALVSIAVPTAKANSFVKGFYRGLSPLARRYGIDIVGGNLSRSPNGIFVDVMVLGETTRAVLRTGARVGDLVGVVGPLGHAALGLRALRRLGRKKALAAYGPFCRAQLRPTPQVEAGAQLSGWATSLIDVSDGLSSELAHLARASRVQIEIDPTLIPTMPRFERAAAELGMDPRALQLAGGEDYALLFTVREKNWAPLRRRLGSAAVIGRVCEGRPGVWCSEGGRRRRLSARAFDHFRSP
jgi:thiamine-monophosphate kinase